MAPFVQEFLAKKSIFFSKKITFFILLVFVSDFSKNHFSKKIIFFFKMKSYFQQLSENQSMEAQLLNYPYNYFKIPILPLLLSHLLFLSLDASSLSPLFLSRSFRFRQH
jgi:hypothetical protein